MRSRVSRSSLLIVAALLVAALLPSVGLSHASPASDSGTGDIGHAIAYERDASANPVLIVLDNGPALAPSPGPAVSRLGLHVTAQELAIWRERWENGAADAFVNTRVGEERSRVLTGRDRFVADSSVWDLGGINPDTEDSACHGYHGSGWGAQRTKAARIRDAAFYALITRDAALMNKVGANLVQQANHPDMDFKKTTPWCPLSKSMRDAATPGFVLGHAMNTSLYTYDYFQIAVAEGWASDLSATQNSQIRSWHRDFAYYLQPALDRHASAPFTDRLNDNYALTGSYQDANYLIHWANPNTYVGGPQVHRAHDPFNNRRSVAARYMMVTGIMTGDDFLIDRARRFTRDWVRYHLYPHGVTADAHRGWGDAWGFNQYVTLGGAYVMATADALARTGDTSLYDYETTTGAHDSAGTPPAAHGGTKSLKFFVQSMARHGNNTLQRTNNSGERLNFREGSHGNLGVHDRFIGSNIYYQDMGLSRDFYRGENGQPPWARANNGTTDLNGDWSLPAPYLMWAGLEGTIWPYPTSPHG